VRVQLRPSLTRRLRGQQGRALLSLLLVPGEQPAHGVAAEPERPRDRPHAHAIPVQQHDLVRPLVAVDA
jgi:hypothetical protein